MNEEEFLKIIGESWLKLDKLQKVLDKLQKALKDNFISKAKVKEVIDKMDIYNTPGCFTASVETTRKKLKEQLGLE